jgi:hypothetical protein
MRSSAERPLALALTGWSGRGVCAAAPGLGVLGDGAHGQPPEARYPQALDEPVTGRRCNGHGPDTPTT